MNFETLLAVLLLTPNGWIGMFVFGISVSVIVGAARGKNLFGSEPSKSVEENE